MVALGSVVSDIRTITEGEVVVVDWRACLPLRRLRGLPTFDGLVLPADLHRIFIISDCRGELLCEEQGVPLLRIQRDRQWHCIYRVQQLRNLCADRIAGFGRVIDLLLLACIDDGCSIRVICAILHFLEFDDALGGLQFAFSASRALLSRLPLPFFGLSLRLQLIRLEAKSSNFAGHVIYIVQRFANDQVPLLKKLFNQGCIVHFQNGLYDACGQED